MLVYSASSVTSLQVSSVWSVGTYIHALATVTSTGAMVIYNNGVSVGSLSGNSPPTMARTYHYIGRSNWGGDAYLNAYIAYVRVYNSLALSATDAATLYSQRYNCKAGMYGSSGSCASCNAGFYTSSSASSLCTSCTVGSFMSSTGSTSCSSCSAGSYCATTGLSAVTGACATGKYSAASATVCSSCLVGSYQASTGSTACTACPGGSYCAITGLTAVTGACAAGFYSASSSTVCSSCPSGTYSSSASSSSCSNCLAGFYQSSTGSTSCASCSAGYFSTTGTTSCAAVLHDFDFRGCTTGAVITDAFSYTATPYNGPTCSSFGMYFDGSNDYLQLTNWNWGGATSFEAFVNYQAFYSWSRIFDFYNGAGTDNVVLANYESSTTASFHIKFFFFKLLLLSFNVCLYAFFIFYINAFTVFQFTREVLIL